MELHLSRTGDHKIEKQIFMDVKLKQQWLVDETYCLFELWPANKASIGINTVKNGCSGVQQKYKSDIQQTERLESGWGIQLLPA